MSDEPSEVTGPHANLPNVGRYAASLRRRVATGSSDSSGSIDSTGLGGDWKNTVAQAPGVRVITQTRRIVTFEATAEAAEALRTVLGADAIVEAVIERDIPRPPHTVPQPE